MRNWLPPNVGLAMMRKKPLHDAVEIGESGAGLHRSLTASDLMLYGVGCSVGAGIYCLVGIGAQIAGPAISLSFLLCGTACIFTSLAYAEFAARIPVTGSAYVYVYVAFGEFWGWLVGWNLTLGYGFTTSVVARSWAEYVTSFLKGILQSVTGSDKFAHSIGYLTRFPIPFPWATDYTCSPLSTVIVALCTMVLVTGAKESSRFNNYMTVLNISVLMFVVVAGVGSESILLDNLEPFAPQGLGGIARGAGLVFYAFIGFDMVACLSEEVIHPEINMPIGIVGSLVISAIIYLSVSLAVVGMAPIDLLGGDVPISNALLANACCTHDQQLEPDAALVCLYTACSPVLHTLLSYGSRFVSFGAIFGLTSGTFTSLMGQPRIFYRMAQDGLLFQIFGKIDPTTRVPTAGIVITGVGAALLACFVEIESLANMISLGTLMVFTFVDAGVIILRWSPSLPLGLFQHGETTDKNTKTHTFEMLAPGTQDVSHNGSKPMICILVFTAGTLFGSIAFTHSWHGVIPILCWIVAVLSALFLMTLPRSAPPGTFSCPWVPIVPLIGIASNASMMGSLPLSSWIFTTLWLLIGVAMYFLYGIRHSRLGKVLLPSRSLSFTETTPLTQTSMNNQLNKL